MKLSAAVTAALLSGTSTSTVASNSSGIASSVRSLNALEQFLQSKEDNVVGRRNRRNLVKGGNLRKGGRTLQKRGIKKLTKKPPIASVGADTSSSSRGGTAALQNKHYGNPYQESTVHTGAMDEHNGITTEAEDYYYGETVHVNFVLTNEFANIEVRTGLNVENMGQWTMGLYERMQHPVCGDVESNEILKVPLTEIIDLRGDDNAIPVDPNNELDGRRVLLDQQPGEGEEQGDNTEDTEDGFVDVENAIGSFEAQEPIDLWLGFTGSAIFDDTSSETLSELVHGTGFHIHLLDENDCPIMGPGGFYLQKTEAMVEAVAAEEQATAAVGVARFNHASIKKSGGGSTSVSKSSTGSGTTSDGRVSGGGGTTDGRNGGIGIVSAINVDAPGKSGGGPVAAMGTNAVDDGDGHPISGNLQALSTTAALDPKTYTIETNHMYYDHGEPVTVTMRFNIPPEERRRLQSGKKRNGGNMAKSSTAGVDDGGREESVTVFANIENNNVENTDQTTTTTTTTTLAPPGDEGSSMEPYMGGDDGEDSFIGDGMEDEDEIDELDISLYKMGVYKRMVRTYLFLCIVCVTHSSLPTFPVFASTNLTEIIAVLPPPPPSNINYRQQHQTNSNILKKEMILPSTLNPSVKILPIVMMSHSHSPRTNFSPWRMVGMDSILWLRTARAWASLILLTFS